MDECSDIIIVGSGPAGIATWLFLHKLAPEIAERTIIIEKEKHPREKLCGGAIGGWSSNVLDFLNIPIDDIGLSINSMTCLFRKDGYSYHIPNFFRVIKRSEFDQRLVTHAKKRGLKIFENEECIQCSYQQSSLTISTNRNEYEAKILVGADGIFSKVRKTFFQHTDTHISSTLEVFTSVNSDVDQEFEQQNITIDFSPILKNIQGYLWHFPGILNNEPYMNHGIVDFHIFPCDKKGDMKSIFLKEMEKRKYPIESLVLKGHPIRWLGANDIISTNRVLLVGDAAGIDSFLGGGIHLCLSYGEIAAKCIIDAVMRDEFSFKSYRAEVNNHLVGKYISKCNQLSIKINNKELNPIHAAKMIFTKKGK